jgi:hypothetical protein
MAQSLFNGPTTELSGPVSFIHTYVDMSNQTLEVNGSTVTTCLPAMGYSFAAGTTDGRSARHSEAPVHAVSEAPCWRRAGMLHCKPCAATAAQPATFCSVWALHFHFPHVCRTALFCTGPGAFNFTQGDPGTGSPFWNLVRDFIATPTPAEIACQARGASLPPYLLPHRPLSLRAGSTKHKHPLVLPLPLLHFVAAAVWIDNSWGWLWLCRCVGFCSRTYLDCTLQAPKPILLPTGECTFPYQWDPTVRVRR